MPSKPTRGARSRRPATAPIAAPAPVRHGAVRRAIESLEHRLMMSVTRDVNGFTVVTPNPDPSVSKVIYVSASGSDTKDGSSPGSAVQTIAKGRSLLRNNSGDQLLLRRGDVFTSGLTNWSLTGKSADDPMVIGAYTDPANPSTQRPMVNTGVGSGFSNLYTASNKPAISHVYVLGVGFEADSRDYRNPPAGKFTTGFLDDVVGGTDGVTMAGPVSDILVEGCSFQYYRAGIVFQGGVTGVPNPSNIRIRRNAVLDSYAPNYDASGHYITSEGIYVNDTNGLTIEENFLDHNGWTDAAYSALGANASIYNHNAYLNSNNTNVVFTGNVDSNAASHGVQMRSGGAVTNNLFINDPIAMSYGYVNGREFPGGVSGVVSGNVVYGSNTISGQQRGWGLEIGNTRPIANGGGTVVKNNVFSTYAGNFWAAIQLTYGVNEVNPDQGVGVNDVTIQNNTVYGWTKGIAIAAGLADNGAGRLGLHGLVVTDNDFQQAVQTPVVDHANGYQASAETWRNNRYSAAAAADNSSTPFFKIGTTTMNLAGWQSRIEPNATVTKVTYPSAANSPGSYNATLSGGATTDAFVAQTRLQSPTFWRKAYTGAAAADYVRAGFAGAATSDNVSPVAALAATPLTSGGAPTYTFTVTYTDDNQLDVITIGSDDLVVTGPGGYSRAATLVAVNPSADGSLATATYSVPAPNGAAWDVAANGAYTVAAQPGSVADKAGNAVTAGPLGSFQVTIVAANPLASLAATTAIESPDQPATLKVTYSVPTGAINIATLGDDDLTVTTPDGNAAGVRFVSADNGANGSPRVATYAVDPPDGGWTSDANGTYTVAVNAGSVATTVGGQVGSATLGTFAVNITTGVIVATLPDITAADTANRTITVQYVDATGVDGATIGSDDLDVQGPNGFDAGAVLQSATGLGTAASPLVAKYTLFAPDGGWQDSYNGAYQVVLQPDAVLNRAGKPLPSSAVGSFQVNIDVYAPAAVATAPALYKVSTAPQTITVNYVDVSGVNASTLGTGDIIVAYPDGTLVTPTFTGKQGSGSSITATYSLPAPAGGWQAALNGDYQVTLQANQVADVKGNVDDFDQNVGAFTVAVDTQAPTATATAPDVVNSTDDEDIIVSYVDDVAGVRSASLDSNDLKVIAPNGTTLPVTFISNDFLTDSTFLTVAYRLAAPAGGWAPKDAGTYKVVLQAGEVTDLADNAIPQTLLGTFNVSVSQAVTAAITPITPDPRNSAVASATITFNQTVAGLNLADLSLTQDGSDNLLNGTQSLTSSDGGMTWVLSNLSAATAAAGHYTLLLSAANSDITGTLGGGTLGDDASATFTVDNVGPVVTAAAGPDVTDIDASPEQFDVTYHDDNAIDANTLDSGDVIVTGPRNYSVIAQLVAVDDATNGPDRTATYSVPAPAGGWSASSNGVYAIRIRAGQVLDTAGNAAFAQFAGAFTVAIGGDSTPPTVTVAAVTPTPRAAPVDALTITFSEPVQGFDLSDLSLTRDGSANVLSATQTLTSPDGGTTWTLGGLTGTTASSGNYLLTVAGGAASGITDTSGNALVNGASGTFRVDVTPPSGTATAPTVVVAGTSNELLTVTYADASGLRATSFDNNDVFVTGPTGANTNATLVSASPAGDGTPRTVTYSVPAPAGGWTTAANGAYAIRVRDGQVFDTLGNPMYTQFLGKFDVTIAAAVDRTPPTAAVTAIATPRTTAVTSTTIVFSEAVKGVDLSDLTLVRSGSTANLLTSAQTLTTADNKTFTLNNLSAVTTTVGTYTLTLKGSGTGITDTAGNALAAGGSTSFTVTTLPGTVSNPSPINNAALTAQPTVFTWTAATNATSYDVKVDGAVVATVTTNKWTANRTFTGNVKHTWQIVAKNVLGVTAGPLWNFTVYTSAPSIPSTPKPASSGTTTLAARPTILDWADSTGATVYSVYLDNVLKGTVTSSQYTVPTTLVKGTHTWHITATNPKGSTAGPTWTFKF